MGRTSEHSLAPLVLSSKRPILQKLRWLSATITLGALATLTTLSIAIGGFLFLDTLKDSDYSIEFVPWAGDALMHGTSILFLLLTVLNYWLSFASSSACRSLTIASSIGK